MMFGPKNACRFAFQWHVIHVCSSVTVTRGRRDVESKINCIGCVLTDTSTSNLKDVVKRNTTTDYLREFHGFPSIQTLIITQTHPCRTEVTLQHLTYRLAIWSEITVACATCKPRQSLTICMSTAPFAGSVSQAQTKKPRTYG